MDQYVSTRIRRAAGITLTIPSRNPYPSSGSVLTLFIAEAAPVALAINNTRAGIPNIIISNADELRYNVFQGPFTKNDQLTAAPFTDSFLYIPNVTASVANQVLPALNGGSASKRSMADEALWGRARVTRRYRAWLKEMERRQTTQMTRATNLTLGYVTTDVRLPLFFLWDAALTRPSGIQGCPDAGDDTLHVPLTYYAVPDYISSNAPNVTSATPVDLVFVDFIESDVLQILNAVQSATTYTSSDVSLYSPTLADAVLGLYAQAMWN